MMSMKGKFDGDQLTKKMALDMRNLRSSHQGALETYQSDIKSVTRGAN